MITAIPATRTTIGLLNVVSTVPASYTFTDLMVSAGPAECLAGVPAAAEIVGSTAGTKTAAAKADAPMRAARERLLPAPVTPACRTKEWFGMGVLS